MANTTQECESRWTEFWEGKRNYWTQDLLSSLTKSLPNNFFLLIFHRPYLGQRVLDYKFWCTNSAIPVHSPFWDCCEYISVANELRLNLLSLWKSPAINLRLFLKWSICDPYWAHISALWKKHHQKKGFSSPLNVPWCPAEVQTIKIGNTNSNPRQKKF